MKEIITTTKKTYELEELLGQGLNSCVYKAKCFDSGHILSQRVALKILKSSHFIRMWKDEFESLAKIKSSYCVRVLGFEKLSQGEPALVLEYIEGVSLLELVSQVELNSQEIKGLCFQIHQGLIELKKFGISHGDLSPGNILIDTLGQVRLLDFGLGNYSPTEGVTYATPEYSAPEVLVGRSWHYWSDLWSLGQLLIFFRKKNSVNNDWKDELQLRIEALTQKSPVSRKWIGFSGYNFKRAKSTLGRKVTEIRSTHLGAQAQTAKISSAHHALVESGVSEGRGIKVLAGQKGVKLLFWGIVVCLGGMWSHGETLGAARLASLNIRTQKWVQLELNEVPLGYAPKKINGLQAGQHKLKWKTSVGTGTKILRLEPGDNLTLKDPFFF